MYVHIHAETWSLGHVFFPLSFSTLMYLREGLSENLEFINTVRLAGQ